MKNMHHQLSFLEPETEDMTGTLVSINGFEWGLNIEVSSIKDARLRTEMALLSRAEVESLHKYLTRYLGE